MASKQTGKELQNVLDQVENVDLRLIFDDLHSLIKVCFQMVGVHSILTGSTSAQLDFQTLMQKAIEANNVLERKYIDTWAKVHDAQVKALEADISTSAKHIAANEKQLWDNIQAIKQDIADIKTHQGHNAQIVDQMENQLMALEAKVKDHTATKHHSQPDPVVYSWDVQPYELNIRTKTSVPAPGHTYEYKYTLNGVEYSINASDAYLKVGTELGTLTYTPLNSGVTKVVIERTS